METAVQSCLLPSALFSEGVKMYVSVHFLPENIKSPGFKLSAIFCEQLLLGKSPEKKNVTVRHGLREWNSRAFGTSPACVRLRQLKLSSFNLTVQWF